MPISFDLEEFRKKHDCLNYFETGLWDPRSNVSSKQALSANFEKIFCVELRDQWVELGKDIFREEINNNRYYLFHDDSTNMKVHLDSHKDVFNNKTMFFLDAHVDNVNIKNFKKICPVLEELNAIASLERKDHVIMIDDLRLIIQPFPWGETSYGQIDWLSTIKEKILSINKDYKFTTLNGHVENDVFCAFIDE